MYWQKNGHHNSKGDQKWPILRFWQKAKSRKCWFSTTYEILLYPDPGSNRDGLPHWCLRPARLPIPPSGHFSNAMQRYGFFFNYQIKLRFFWKNFFFSWQFRQKDVLLQADYYQPLEGLWHFRSLSEPKDGLANCRGKAWRGFLLYAKIPYVCIMEECQEWNY